MYKSHNLNKIQQPPKIHNTHYSHIVNSDLPQSKSLIADSTVKVSLKKKISADSTPYDKKITQLYSFQDQRIKAKAIVINYFDNVLKAAYTEDIFADIEAIQRSVNFDQLIENILTLLSKAFQIEKHRHLHKYIQSQKSKGFQKEVSLSLRSKEAKLLRIIREDSTNDKAERGKSKKKYQDLISANQTMKKQIFELREQKLQLQRKILEIIEEYKARKQFYLAEIKKLTEIINMSSFDVRNLVLEKTKEAKVFENRSEQSKYQEAQLDVPRASQKQKYDQEQVEYPDSNNIVYNLHQKQRNLDESRGLYNGYNTEIRILKGVSSIQNIEDYKTSSRLYPPYEK